MTVLTLLYICCYWYVRATGQPQGHVLAHWLAGNYSSYVPTAEAQHAFASPWCPWLVPVPAVGLCHQDSVTLLLPVSTN